MRPISPVSRKIRSVIWGLARMPSIWGMTPKRNACWKWRALRDSEVLAARATLELHRGQSEKALALFGKAVDADPFDHWNHYQRMLILSRLGRKAEAEEERQTVERLKPNRTDSRSSAGCSCGTRSIPICDSEAASWLMAHGHDDEAVDWANLVLKSDPTHAAMNRLLADHYRKKGEAGLANFYKAQTPRPSSGKVEPLTTGRSQL